MIINIILNLFIHFFQTSFFSNLRFLSSAKSSFLYKKPPTHRSLVQIQMRNLPWQNLQSPHSWLRSPLQWQKSATHWTEDVACTSSKSPTAFHPCRTSGSIRIHESFGLLVELGLNFSIIFSDIQYIEIIFSYLPLSYFFVNWTQYMLTLQRFTSETG